MQRTDKSECYSQSYWYNRICVIPNLSATNKKLRRFYYLFVVPSFHSEITLVLNLFSFCFKSECFILNNKKSSNAYKNKTTLCSHIYFRNIICEIDNIIRILLSFITIYCSLSCYTGITGTELFCKYLNIFLFFLEN